MEAPPIPRLRPDPTAWGVQTSFRDAGGRRQRAAGETVAAILTALDADADHPGEVGAPLMVEPGEELVLPPGSELVLEDRTVLGRLARLPPDLPLGYHTLATDAGERPLIATPRVCPLPSDRRLWGWAVQLYALRSRRSWGIGDLGDLAELARWSAADLGAGMLLVNPLHAAVPSGPQQASPYYPSSRRFRNPLYLRVEDVPGSSELGDELATLAAAGKALNAGRLIDRNTVLALKLDALGRIWERRKSGRTPPDHGALRDFAVHCTLAELHGPDWRAWPEELRQPGSAATRRLAEQRADRVAFHAWLQQVLDDQLAAASTNLSVMHDLAVGVDPGGADAWCWQDVLAPGMRVGAPPDEFNLAGQDWGLPPFDPWRLRRAGYRQFAETIRAGLGHAGALRVDHVMGLFRLYWIPEGASPAAGAYVRYPVDDLLDVLALEAHRANAFVVGEDLGTVDPEMRTALAARNVLSYRLLWFEAGAPAGYPERAMSAVTTHDLPTVAGLWTGADLKAQRAIGIAPNQEATQEIVDKLATLTGLAEGSDVDAVVAATYRALADAPSAVLAATLDDALGVVERPNMPGTTDQWPNWRLALPVSLEKIEEDPRVAGVAASLRERGDPPPSPAGSGGTSR